TDQALRERVRGLIGTASKRGILTIAERVEDANTMAVLFQLGAAYMQGHYVHEPEVVLAEAR
ncbi:MAG TPA: EAL domain-containing protein, partial [Gammaproteobacteria bacterium]|nr:EAL domain-containing protein [Gammaproteobacteria bacterium]